MKISVLRIGHRYGRDDRISTHVALVARAFGADEIVMDARDTEVEKSIMRVVDEWGGVFEVKFVKNWKKFVENFRGEKIHLTMYGVNINDKMNEIRKSRKNKLIIVGGKKVPSEVYKMVDYNLAIGNQPHSEVSALAVFLDRLLYGRELEKKFYGKKTIIPQARGKKLIEK